MIVKTSDNIYEVEVFRTSYANNDSLAVFLETTDGEPFCRLTVNLPDSIASEDYQYVDTNNIPWALDFIESNDLGVNTGIVGYSGFCEYPLVKFNLDKIKEVK